MKICLPLNLFKNESVICGCKTPIIDGETVYIVKDVVIGDNRIKKGDSSLAFCGTCLTEKFPEFKDIK